MSGYLGTKAVTLSTTSATVGGDSTVGGDLTVDTNTLYVDSTNNRVGVGTVSPSSLLDVDQSQDAETNIELTNTNTGSSAQVRTKYTTDGGLFTVGKTSNAHPYGGDAYIYNVDNTNLRFATSDTERMRLTAAGDLLVGKTDTTFNNDGIRLDPDGRVIVTNTSNNSLLLNRTSTDGSIMTFSKDGSTVGSIAAIGGDLIIFSTATGHSGLRFASTYVGPTDNSGTSVDNTFDMGAAAYRWDDIYATNGTIQTSDQNEKQQIAALTDAEMTAAKAISKLFKTFKWNDSVAEKGDTARTHAGVIAQEVETAMTDAGLNAGDYAFFISTTWWEADGETYETAEEAPEGATERNRKGIRYPQLLSFIGAATEQRLASIETRLDALEGN